MKASNLTPFLSRNKALAARGDASVMVVGEGDKVEVRQVTATQAIGDKWLISEGLKSGDQVIVSGLQKARPGEQVKATTDTPADTASK